MIHQQQPQDQPQQKSKMQQGIDDLNDMMTMLVPELDSEYAAFPMAMDRWLAPEDTLENRDLCFIPALHEDDYLLPDYIWMPERKGLRNLPAGYYHLKTHEAYIEVYARLKKAHPGLLSHKRDRQLYCKLQEVIENRLMCDIPDDAEAARMRLFNTSNLRAHTERGGVFGKLACKPTLSAVTLSHREPRTMLY